MGQFLQTYGASIFYIFFALIIFIILASLTCLVDFYFIKYGHFLANFFGLPGASWGSP